jgi:hypothetical protein
MRLRMGTPTLVRAVLVHHRLPRHSFHCTSPWIFSSGFITTPCALHCLCRKPELWPLKHPFGYSMAELVSTWYIEDDWNVRVFGGHWQWPQHEACPPMSM